MKRPKLRDSSHLLTEEPYIINELPENIIIKIAGYFVYLLYIGRKDIAGSDWGGAFSAAIGGRHLDSPIGIADVVYGKMAWSMKTVKHNNPFCCKNIRLISGRCSPDYSYGITDPPQPIHDTARAVLGICNERIKNAQDNYNPVRTSILIRSSDLLSYCLFEEDCHRFRTNDYVWEVNSNGNLVGRNIETGRICFTWQPHGSQFTIHTQVPETAVKFRIKQPPILTCNTILETLKFDKSWVEIVNKEN